MPLAARLVALTGACRLMEEHMELTATMIPAVMRGELRRPALAAAALKPGMTPE